MCRRTDRPTALKPAGWAVHSPRFWSSHWGSPCPRFWPIWRWALVSPSPRTQTRCPWTRGRRCSQGASGTWGELQGERKKHKKMMLHQRKRPNSSTHAQLDTKRWTGDSGTSGSKDSRNLQLRFDRHNTNWELFQTHIWALEQPGQVESVTHCPWQRVGNYRPLRSPSNYMKEEMELRCINCKVKPWSSNQ